MDTYGLGKSFIALWAKQNLFEPNWALAGFESTYGKDSVISVGQYALAQNVAAGSQVSKYLDKKKVRDLGGFPSRGDLKQAITQAALDKVPGIVGNVVEGVVAAGEQAKDAVLTGLKWTVPVLVLGAGIYLWLIFGRKHVS